MEDEGCDVELAAGNAVAAMMQSLIRKKRRRTMGGWASALAVLEEEFNEADEDEAGGVTRRRRVYVRPDYEQSAWSVMLRSKEELNNPSSRPAKMFRRRFRLPYPVFVHLVGIIRERSWFPSKETDVAGRKCIPLEMKVLASLQILGRGVCFDDVSQLSLMSEATVCSVFHTFCSRFVKEFYREYINLPTGDNLTKVMGYYHKLGFSGAIGSTDVTHVKWDCCPYSLQRSYTGKEGYPTIAYQATVDFSGRVLGTTAGFAGAHNDKTIIRYDLAVQKVREDPLYTEQTFGLKLADGTTKQHKGNYLIVDNGYHKWRVLIEPTKSPANKQDTMFSKWLESVRKDVECFFGRVKGRFRILKLPLLFRQKIHIDNIWFTCCILHNLLHEYDGLDKLEDNVHWAGQDGLHDAWIADPETDVSTVGMRSGGVGEEKMESESEHDLLKNALIESFTYRAMRNDITWLSRNM